MEKNEKLAVAKMNYYLLTVLFEQFLSDRITIKLVPLYVHDDIYLHSPIILAATRS